MNINLESETMKYKDKFLQQAEWIDDPDSWRGAWPLLSEEEARLWLESFPKGQVQYIEDADVCVLYLCFLHCLAKDELQ